MIKKLFIITLFILFNTNISWSKTIAFGYLKNNSQQLNYNFLQTIFPNSFASSLRATKDINTYNPKDIDKLLKRFKQKLKLSYNDHELPDLTKKINADYFIFGSFFPLENHKIKITMHMYIKESKELFTFEETGTMETQIFKLVDHISDTFVHLSKRNLFYKGSNIPAGAKLAFITNISGEELNNLYLPFLKNSYSIKSVQSTDLKTYYHVPLFNSFNEIFTTTGLRSIKQTKTIHFKYGTWKNIDQAKRDEANDRVLRLYYYNYTTLKIKELSRLSNAYNNNIDFLFIINFDKDRDRAWLRCLEMKSYKVIWYENKIESSGETESSIQDIAGKIINKFNKKSQTP